MMKTLTTALIAFASAWAWAIGPIENAVTANTEAVQAAQQPAPIVESVPVYVAPAGPIDPATRAFTGGVQTFLPATKVADGKEEIASDLVVYPQVVVSRTAQAAYKPWNHHTVDCPDQRLQVVGIQPPAEGRLPWNWRPKYRTLCGGLPVTYED